jgi:general secretion pathway protein L
MSTLIVTLNLPSQPNPELEYCLASNAQTVSSHGSAVPALLPHADETVLLLPSLALSWHQLSLPKLARSTSAQKIRAVLDGLVEEQLLDDTSTVHIATYRASGQANPNATWVAVCDKQWLLQELQAIQSAGHRVSRIAAHSYPLAAAVSQPSDEDDSILVSSARVHVSGSSEMATVTVANDSGVLSVPLAHAHAVWPELWKSLEVSGTTITAEPAAAAAAEALLDNKVVIVQSAQHALQVVLDARSMGLDLAQGDVAVAGSGRWLQKAGALARDLLGAPAWRMARWGAALLLIAHVAGLNAWAWKERNTLDAKRRQTTQILTQSFPQVKVVVDAPAQMQRELAALRLASGGLGNRDLESLYARFAALGANKAVPTSIDFTAGEVSIKGLGLSASQLSELQPRLRAAGLAARSEGERVIVSEAISVTSTTPSGTPTGGTP